MLLYFLLSYYICSSNLHNLLYFCRLFRIFLLEVCLSMWDLLVETRHWRVNFTRKILESKRILGAKWVKTLSYLVYSERGFAKWDLWLTLPQGCVFQQSCIKIKISRNFYLHTSSRYCKRFCEGLYSIHETFLGTTKNCENKYIS